MAMAPRRAGARVLVTRMAVGPSAPPMIPIAAASLGSNTPEIKAKAKATKTPSCAPAPMSRDLGLEIRGVKSVMAPIPTKIRQG